MPSFKASHGVSDMIPSLFLFVLPITRHQPSYHVEPFASIFCQGRMYTMSALRHFFFLEDAPHSPHPLGESDTSLCNLVRNLCLLRNFISWFTKSFVLRNEVSILYHLVFMLSCEVCTSLGAPWEHMGGGSVEGGSTSFCCRELQCPGQHFYLGWSFVLLCLCLVFFFTNCINKLGFEFH